VVYFTRDAIQLHALLSVHGADKSLMITPLSVVAMAAGYKTTMMIMIIMILCEYSM